MRIVNTFSITQMTKGKLPRLPFARMKTAVLGSRHTISLVFIGDKRSRTLNKKYRKKDRPTNVLSFPIADSEGEIFINLAQARREAHKFHISYNSHVARLFIHALLHLKGFRHSSKMAARLRTSPASNSSTGAHTRLRCPRSFSL